ncbi:hypothetical protein BGZ65_006677, partial [Modicella reniformis]
MEIPSMPETITITGASIHDCSDELNLPDQNLICETKLRYLSKIPRKEDIVGLIQEMNLREKAVMIVPEIGILDERAVIVLKQNHERDLWQRVYDKFLLCRRFGDGIDIVHLRGGAARQALYFLKEIDIFHVPVDNKDLWRLLGSLGPLTAAKETALRTKGAIELSLKVPTENVMELTRGSYYVDPEET